MNHKILLKKLQNYGIRGVAYKWFESYLTNHYQTAKIADTLSETKLITCGVPQGSILGPILFLIHVNEIKNSSKILDFYLFADDISTLLTSKNVKTIAKTYNQELKGLIIWLQANKQTVNVDKSNLVLSKECKHKTDELVIKIYQEQIKEKEYTKYLELVIDNQLFWQHHIKYLNLKVVKGIGIITKLWHYASKKTLRMLYFPFVQPPIEIYKSNINIVKKTHKKAVRKMLFKKYNHSTKPLFNELNILSFDKQIDYFF